MSHMSMLLVFVSPLSLLLDWTSNIQTTLSNFQFVYVKYKSSFYQLYFNHTASDDGYTDKTVVCLLLSIYESICFTFFCCQWLTNCEPKFPMRYVYVVHSIPNAWRVLAKGLYSHASVRMRFALIYWKQGLWFVQRLGFIRHGFRCVIIGWPYICLSI